MERFSKYIPEQFRGRVLKVILLIPVKAILDLAGAAALIPVLILVLDNDALEKSAIIQGLFGPDANLLLVIPLCVVVFLILKSILSVLIVQNRSRCLLALYKYYSGSLFDNLYHKGLLFIKGGNPSEMAFNINSVCYAFCVSYLSAQFEFIGECLLSLFIMVALLVYSPIAALWALVVFLPAVAVYLIFVRRPLKRMGMDENDARRQQFRVVTETFRGYSEIEVNDAFGSIRRLFDRRLDDIAKDRSGIILLQSIPAYLLEFVAVIIVAVLVFTNIGADKVFLGVFAVAMLRLLPSVKMLISSWSAIKSTRFTRDVVEKIVVDLPYRDFSDAGSEPLSFDSLISVEDMSFSFGEVPVLEHLSFEIRKGERFGIRGRTGAGKTTLFNLMLGLYKPTSGSIKIDGRKLDESNIGAWHKIVGYVPQDVFIADMSILDNVALGFEHSGIDRERVEEVLRKVSLSQLVDSLPEGLDTVVGDSGCRLSGGQRQRIGIARALYKQPQVLFLDEATSSLDTQTETSINDAISRLADDDDELTIVVISHRDSTLAFCDRILEI